MEPRVERVTVHVLRHDAFQGYRVAFLTDFHFPPWQNRSVLAGAVDILNSWAPDLVALGGDYGYSVPFIPPLARASYRSVIPRVALELSRLRAKDGVFAVLGNHDLYAGTDVVEAEFSAIGIQLLRDEVHTVVRGAHRLRVVGIVDPAYGVTLSDEAQTDADMTLLISHHPVSAQGCEATISRSPYVIVAGHTHGGQITFPLVGAPITLSRVATRRFPAGFVPNETGPLYVSRGLGEQVPLRIGAAREITLLEFASR